MKAIKKYVREHFWAVFWVTLLIVFIAIVVLPNRVRSPEREQWENPSLDFLLFSLERPPNELKLQWATEKVREHSEDQEWMEGLRVAAEQQDVYKAGMANLILFRLRDEPERRLDRFVQIIQGSSDAETTGMVSMLDSYLDNDDADYVEHLEPLLSSDNLMIARTIGDIIGRYSPESGEQQIQQ